MPIIAENETLCCSYILKIEIMITKQALKRSSDCKIEIYEELGALVSSLISFNHEYWTPVEIVQYKVNLLWERDIEDYYQGLQSYIYLS